MEFLGVDRYWENILLLLVLGIVTVLLVKCRRDGQYSGRLPPGPWGLPVIGAVFRLGPNPYLDFTKMAAEYGNVFSLQLGSRLAIVLNGADAIRELLGKKSAVFADRPDLYTFQAFSNGRGISLLQYSPKQQFVHKVCQNAVHKYLTTDILDEKILVESSRLMESFRKEQGKPMDPKQILCCSTANIILGAVFGTDFGHADKDLLKAIFHNSAISELLVANNAVDIIPWLRVFPNKTIDRLRECSKLFIDFVQKLYHPCKEKYSKGHVRSVVDSILKAAEEEKQKNEEGMSKEIEFDELDIIYATRDMFAAGFDSVAMTLHWALAYFVTYPSIQRTLHEELDTVLPNDGLVSIKETKKLPYLRATVYEVLRITSLTPLSIPHSTTADTTFAGYTIPKGTMIIPNLWSANRDPNVWKDPDDFKPERFLDEQGHVVDPKLMPSFLPFSIGRRKCLGEDLAYVELFVFLANLLKNFQFLQVGLSPPDMIGMYGLGLNLKPYQVKARDRVGKKEL